MARGKELSATDLQIGQDLSTTFSTTSDEVVSDIITAVPGPVFSEKMKIEAFMNEPVTVLVHDSTDDQSDPRVTVFNSGIPQTFIRGMEIEVKRRYVEVLARAKPEALSQADVKDSEGYVVSQKVNKRSSLRYPFSVIEDRNPNGRAWLRKVLAEA